MVLASHGQEPPTTGFEIRSKQTIGANNVGVDETVKTFAKLSTTDIVAEPIEDEEPRLRDAGLDLFNRLKAELHSRDAEQQRSKANTPLLSDTELNVRLEDYIFFSHCQSSTRILCLIGAGLSTPSGIPTFRDPSGWWRNYDPAELATPGAFRRDPAIVWQFYNYYRHGALTARPNHGHLALAELCKYKDSMSINQNIDGLCERAGHTSPELESAHGSLFEARCTKCSYVEVGSLTDPIVPALEFLEDTGIADIKVSMKDIPLQDLPFCPAQDCGCLLRPGVVWFGESLPYDPIERIDAWMDRGPIDLMVVVGTTAKVYAAAGYIHAARKKGAKTAVVNMEDNGEETGMAEPDWFFRGDASQVSPGIFEEVVGMFGEVPKTM
ncbi:hypothetical protein LTS18_012619 [Coniosporium uncinatum]|uniref:Uncharacterized protein n=1 Tax=Coniosporium uncinatum TaxID=93489 RepID=A0ACC3CXN4_9PEZI|nr:hypothetical protein LTS18_012619 [Coniosporium uncinatum]